MRVTPFVLAGSLLLAASPLSAQGKPDFSGTWKLNTEKSDPAGGGGRGGGGAATLSITQDADKLVINAQMGEQTRTSTYLLNGQESTNPGMRGSESKSKARFEGATLVIESTMAMGDATITTKEVRSLSADGNELTVVRTSTTPQGEQTRKLVYDKQ